jgi:hypothetical protein
MLDQRGITGVDHRVVIRGVGDADLQIVGLMCCPPLCAGPPASL